MNSGIRTQNPESSGKLTPGFWLLTPVPHGFTLVEVLVVIMIIVLLAGLTVGASRYAWTKAASSRAQAEIAALETALESYKIDLGRYPNSTAARASAASNSGSLLTALTGGTKKYFSFTDNQTQTVTGVRCIVDPFGNPYNYFRRYPAPAAQTNQVTFDLWSYGPDGQNDTGDDIKNWRQ